MNNTVNNNLPKRGRKSPKYSHLGMWNLSLGPNSPIPGNRLEVCILDQNKNIVRRFEQIKGTCTDQGYADFFGYDNRPSENQYPLVDINQDGKLVAVICPHYSQEMGMALYLRLIHEWVTQHGKPEYAIQ